MNEAAERRSATGDAPVEVGAGPASARLLADVAAIADDVRGDPVATMGRLPALTESFMSAAGLADQWSVMATLGAVDLTVARTVEPHVDALTILDEAGTRPPRSGAAGAWGVYAAEGSTARLTAEEVDGAWLLTGTKPWCSLAGLVDRALVTAWTGPTARRLFAVRTADAEIGDDPWVARGLTAIASPTLTFTRVPAVPVGGDDWYLTRPGFAAGGIRVAAVWFGAAVAVGRTLRRATAGGRGDQIGSMHLGAVEAALHQARCVLADAAARLTAPSGQGPEPADAPALALLARRAVRAAAEEVIERTGHALGPTPLVRDPRHAARVADLEIYLRQEHAERDEAALGRWSLEHGGLVL